MKLTSLQPLIEEIFSDNVLSISAKTNLCKNGWQRLDITQSASGTFQFILASLSGPVLHR